jgi:ABC-2 type transport system permease protein
MRQNKSNNCQLMLIDIKTIIWKYWQEIIAQHGSVGKTLLNELLSLAIFAIFFSYPVEESPANTSNTVISFWYMMPYILVFAKAPDSFAGERERHTLITLLSTRLSNSTIVLGKIFAVASYAWLLTLVESVFLLIKANILDRENTFVFYPWQSFLFGVISSLLICLLMATIGIFSSFRAKTVRQAQQHLGLLSLLIILVSSVLIFTPGIIVAIFLHKDIFRGNATILAASALINLAFLNLLSIFYTLKQFKRNQLILD